MDVLHDGIDAPSFVVRFEEAELTKFVDNSWHAVKVVFANEIGRVCQKLEISASRMHEMFVADTKLNISAYYTRPGGAFGGSCLPKDVRALQYIASDVGANAHLIDSLLRSNEAHKNYQFQTIAADAGAAGCGGRDRGAAGGLRAVSGRIGRADRSRAPVCPAGRRNRASGDAGAGGARAARSARARPAGRGGAPLRPGGAGYHRGLDFSGQAEACRLKDGIVFLPLGAGTGAAQIADAAARLVALMRDARS